MMTVSLTVLISIVTLFFPVTLTVTNESSPASTRPLRKVPGGGTSWLKQREGGYIYADKSSYLEHILDNPEGDMFFYITRPRRFGKTSLLSMANHFFIGNKTLFDGLHIGNRGNADFFNKPEDGGVPEEMKLEKWIQCPVIYMDFRRIESFNNMSTFLGLYYKLLRTIAKSYGLDYSLKTEPVISVPDLIFELQLKFKIKVVILIDEYDSPFHNALVKKKNVPLAEEIRCFLDDLFGAIKSEIDRLRLVLVLGVSRLQLINLESGPNNFVDLTYEEKFAGAFGFTSDEINDFRPEIANRFNLTTEEGIDKFLDKLREKYDGYNFTFQYNNGKKKNVLNPVSTITCLKNKKFGCYWTDTSNANEVVRRLYFSREPLKAFEHRKLSRDDIEAKQNLGTESIRIEILMLLYGYFTIESYDEGTEDVVLNFPNEEIKTALQNNIDIYNPQRDVFLSEEHGWSYELRWHMETGHLEGTMNVIRAMFKNHFSQTIQQGANEFSITARLIDRLKAAGIFCRESVEFMKETSSKQKGGDVDLFTLYLDKNFIMSIKYGKQSATIAIEQLINYLRDHRTKFLQAIDDPSQRKPREAWFVGMNFDSRTGGTLHEWIGIPFAFENSSLCFDQCKASLPTLCVELLKDLKVENKNAMIPE